MWPRLRERIEKKEQEFRRLVEDRAMLDAAFAGATMKGFQNPEKARDKIASLREERLGKVAQGAIDKAAELSPELVVNEHVADREAARESLRLARSMQENERSIEALRAELEMLKAREDALIAEGQKAREAEQEAERPAFEADRERD